MAVTRIECGGKDFYFKITKRAFRNWENRGEGRSRNKIMNLSVDDEMDLYLAGLQDGAKIEGVKFKMTLNELFDFDAEHDLISKIDKATEESLKK
jgi:hypothetical protein